MGLPNPIAENAFKLAVCVEALTKQGHSIDSVKLDERQAAVMLKYTHSLRKLHGIYRGVIGANGGKFYLREIKIHGVCVQWLTPYLELVQGRLQ